ncbi:Fibroin P25 [Operophtera brumata]|uniref:Fibroin P25 n=1 Tax=Operophtera brumata TaxID=104452 RepID=A0A0L7L1X1_OPEBR|nr:Fibroin P25 [Operophtera brumata]
MILILFVALFGFGDCTSGGAVSGVYDEFRDLAENLKIAGEYRGQQYEQNKDNINSYNKGDGKNKGYNYNDRDGDKSDRDGDKKDGRGYLEDYKDYDGGQKYEDQKDNTGYGNRDGDRIGFDDKNDNRKNRGGYGEYYNGDKLDKYDGPEDYLISDKYRESDRDYRYDRNNRRLGSDLREYDYVEKCDEKEKNCKDGRNDREDQLIRPCALDDRQCIRKYFAQNSKCKPAYGPIPDPLYLKRNTVYFPFANITLLRTRVRITGLSSIKINEFYVNKDTGNLVIALDFQNMNQSSPRNLNCIRKFFASNSRCSVSRGPAPDPVIFQTDTVYLSYVNLTVVLDNVQTTPYLQLDKADIHADVADSNPPYAVGPYAYNSTDPSVQRTFNEMTSTLPQALRESFVLKSSLLLTVFIQNNICDFACNYEACYGATAIVALATCYNKRVALGYR